MDCCWQLTMGWNTLKRVSESSWNEVLAMYWKMHIFFIKNIHTVAVVHPASYSKAIARSFCRGKRLEREVDHSCQFNVEIKNEWSYAAILPTCLHGVEIDRFKFLGQFAKFRKAAISFVMPFCPSVRPSVLRMKQLDSHWTGFHKTWYLSTFRKLLWKFKFNL